ncbi:MULTISPECIES: peroxide stress protein YaaA [Corynebacterium]|uniref:peroxide stress protein YaaA n=1 Tax=Corynebacterium TaxID=1716 RepID=UPI00195CB533|nr:MULTISPECIES: peroxide stress protein YaaA [Corynebacterium]MDN8623645.1 peroxide stress protein YaaA [Corynebacterium kroppenstedtii]QRQ64503.1 peroxide stress protein YaaA [Corynebacterium kroppenstedtii]
MLIILPPSESQSRPADTADRGSSHGDGPTLDWDTLHFPSLNPTRQEIAHELIALCNVETEEGRAQAREVLGLSERLDAERASNAQLLTSQAAPALTIYTGVLYDALAPSGRKDPVTKAGHICPAVGPLSAAAMRRLAIGSALFGVISADDFIPHHRLSGTVTLNDSTMRARWKPALTQALVEWRGSTDAQSNAVFDFRSGTYRHLGPVPGATELRVETIDAAGKRKVVSHFNKFYKGLVARHLAEASECKQEHAAELLSSVIDKELGFATEIRPGAVKGTKGDLVTMLIPQ